MREFKVGSLGYIAKQEFGAARIVWIKSPIIALHLAYLACRVITLQYLESY